MKKKLLTYFLICLSAFSVFSFSGCGSKESQDSSSSESRVLPGDCKALDFDISVSKFNNDKTGNWHCAKFAEADIDFPYYALDYYNKYFTDDSEVHVVYNFSLKTVYRITCHDGDLYVTALDYVDKEEHDAALACSGTVLADYIVHVDTGEVEKTEDEI